jgi:hypothetical protein
VSFRIDEIGSGYSNAGGLLTGQCWTDGELSGPDGLAAIYPDADLLQLAQGAIGSDFLTGDEDCDVPFPTDPGETVVFAIQNIYTWENRPRGDQLASGLKAFQVKPGEWMNLRLLGEPRTYNLVETLDSGALYLTDRRYVFLGRKRRIDDDFSRIKAVLPFRDGIGVFRKDRSKIEFYKGPFYWPLVGAVLAGLAAKWRHEHAARETRRDPGV